MIKNIGICLIAAISLFAFSNCKSAGPDLSAYNVDVYAPGEALGFKINKTEEGRSSLITFSNPWQGASDETFHLLVLRDGEEAPENFEGAVIDGEAKRIVCMSSTQVAMLEALGASDRIIGVSGLDFIQSPDVVNRRSQIVDVGYDTNIDFERLVMADPDLVMLYGVNGPNMIESKLRELEIPYTYIGEYVEQSPLGKAEWIVALGEIVGKKDEAETTYKEIRTRYLALKDSVAQLEKPRIMINSPYGDTWLMPSPDNYAGRLIADAGGEYVLSRKSGNGSIPVDIEDAYLMASGADIWINTGNASTVEDFAEEVPYFTDTKPFKGKLLFNNTARKLPGGGNDYYETAIVEPHILLADLIAIFHPEVLPDHNFKYYLKLK